MLAKNKPLDVVDNYRLTFGSSEYVPIMVGGMGVNISTAELALVACRLGGIGHISDAMNPFVSDKKFQTHYTKEKSNKHRESRDSFDKTAVKFDLEALAKAQRGIVRSVMEQKSGDGMEFLGSFGVTYKTPLVIVGDYQGSGTRQHLFVP